MCYIDNFCENSDYDIIYIATEILNFVSTLISTAPKLATKLCFCLSNDFMNWLLDMLFSFGRQYQIESIGAG